MYFVKVQIYMTSMCAKEKDNNFPRKNKKQTV